MRKQSGATPRLFVQGWIGQRFLWALSSVLQNVRVNG
jgi:hypothetical protein